MAARKRRGVKNIPDEWRQRIRGSMLINRLTDHALGKIDLTATQVQSIKILLGKVMPDLQSVEATIDGEIQQRVVSAAAMTPADWEREYAESHDEGALH